jgi:hypothetical protein
MSRLATITMLIGTLGVAACRTAGLPGPSASFERPVDQPCNPANGTFTEPTREVGVGNAFVRVPRRYTARYESGYDLELLSPLTTIDVWQGGQFTFPLMTPAVSTECTISRGDTTITIRTVMNNANDYRVDVIWAPTINNQFFYMQMATRSVSRLKEMRAFIETTRFAVDSGRSAKGQ